MPRIIRIRYARRFWTLPRLFTHLEVPYKKGYLYYRAAGSPKVFTRRMAEELTSSSYTPSSIFIVVDGHKYPSCRQAALSLGLPYGRVYRRVKTYGNILSKSDFLPKGQYYPKTPKLVTPPSKWSTLSSTSNTGAAHHE